MQSFGAVSFSSGASFMELMRRPNLTVDDSEAIERLATDGRMVDIWLGGRAARQPTHAAHVLPRRTHPPARRSWARRERFVDINFAKMLAGRVFTEQEVQRAAARRGHRLRRRTRRCSSKRGIDPIGKTVRIGALEYTVLGVIGKRPAAGGFSLRPGRLRDHSLHAFRKQFGNERVRRGRSAARR